MMDRADGPVVKPEVVHLFEIIRDVVAGKIRVPAFQRPFVWNRTQMTDLLDSVRQQFPIGSLLLWRSADDRETLPRIGPVDLPAPEPPAVAEGVRAVPRDAVRLLLDGHQRVSTLVGLLWPGGQTVPAAGEDPGRWKVWFDAKEERFEHLRDGTEPEPHHYPVHRMMDTLDILEESQRMLLSGDPDAATWVKRVQDAVRRFQTYKLPVVTIEQTDLNEAVEIFARLHTKGRAMSADEMFSALTYREGAGGFHLARRIDAIMMELSALGFPDVPRVIALRATLAVIGEDIYRTDWTRIGQATRAQVAGQLPGATEKARSALRRAAHFLRGLGVANDRLLPYSMQLVVLAAFFGDCPAPSPTQRRFLERWFWVSSFTGWFAVGNPSRVRHLVSEFRERVALEDAPVGLEHIDLEQPALPFPTTFDMRSSRARALLCVMVARGPLGPDGNPIPEPWRHVKEFGPEALGVVCARAAKDLRSSPANRIIAPAPADRRQGKAWLLSLAESVRKDVLDSHFIDGEAYACLERRDHDAFILRRRDLLIEAENAFMQARGVHVPVGERVATAPIDTDGPEPFDVEVGADDGLGNDEALGGDDDGTTDPAR